MRPIEQAEIAVLKLPGKQRQPDASVRYVRDRRNDRSSMHEETAQVTEARCGVGEVLQYVVDNDDVEAGLTEIAFPTGRRDIGDDHPLAVLCGLIRCRCIC